MMQILLNAEIDSKGAFLFDKFMASKSHVLNLGSDCSPLRWCTRFNLIRTKWLSALCLVQRTYITFRRYLALIGNCKNIA